MLKQIVNIVLKVTAHYKLTLLLLALCYVSMTERSSTFEKESAIALPQSFIVEMEKSEVFSKANQHKNYSFKKVRASFGGINLRFASYLPTEELEKVVLQSLPRNLRVRFKEYLPYTLKLSSYYGVDPFWVISVMWVESHFDTGATSHKGARGLMQIIPQTAKSLTKILKPEYLAKKDLFAIMYNPYHSIEMGISYLNTLQKMFRYDFRYATAAYNMGPTKARNDYTDPEFIAYENDYYLKVKGAYDFMTNSLSARLHSKPKSYQYTFVVKPQLLLISQNSFLTDFVDNMLQVNPLPALDQHIYKISYNRFAGVIKL